MNDMWLKLSLEKSLTYIYLLPYFFDTNRTTSCKTTLFQIRLTLWPMLMYVGFSVLIAQTQKLTDFQGRLR